MTQAAHWQRQTPFNIMAGHSSASSFCCEIRLRSLIAFRFFVKRYLPVPPHARRDGLARRGFCAPGLLLQLCLLGRQVVIVLQQDKHMTRVDHIATTVTRCSKLPEHRQQETNTRVGSHYALMPLMPLLILNSPLASLDSNRVSDLAIGVRTRDLLEEGSQVLDGIHSDMWAIRSSRTLTR